MATLGLKEMGKFLWEDREKSLPCWLSQFSFAKEVHTTRNLLFWKQIESCQNAHVPKSCFCRIFDN